MPAEGLTRRKSTKHSTLILWCIENLIVQCKTKVIKVARDGERDVKGMKLSDTISISEEYWVQLHEHYIHSD